MSQEVELQDVPTATDNQIIDGDESPVQNGTLEVGEGLIDGNVNPAFTHTQEEEVESTMTVCNIEPVVFILSFKDITQW